MEWNRENLLFLSQLFPQTLSPVSERRRAAEKFISEATDLPNYGLSVLVIVAELTLDEQIRHAAAVNFKNHLRARWLPSADSGISPIINEEKEKIKTLIVSHMLSCTPPIQRQLSEAMAVIGKHDFPKSWPDLIPDLIDKLIKSASAGDYASVNGILGTASSIFKKFRYHFRTNDLYTDLKYCLDNFAAPLTEIFRKTSSLIDSIASSGGSATIFKPLFECQRLCCRIFYSLNFQDLPEFFEDHMDEWMEEFKKCLNSDYSAFESTADGLTLVDGLRVAVCENINLYMEKNEEEFQRFLKDFALAIGTFLQNVSNSPSRDRLATTAIKFMTTVSTSVHHALFADDIEVIIQSVVIPNASLKDGNEKLFEMDYMEFIRRDIEGCDVDTRRRMACDLVKGLAKNYETQVTKVIEQEINKQWASFTKDRAAHMKEMDCFIFLLVSMPLSGMKKALECKFLANQIVPQLRGFKDHRFPMLQAWSLKFLIRTIRNIPKCFAGEVLQLLIHLLQEKHNVTHSYAAICIEKVLKQKDKDGNLFARVDGTSLPELMRNLFDALKFPKSEENQYLMKCIMRVLSVAEIDEISCEFAEHYIERLISILFKVCPKPKNATFNHYVFESVAVLVRRASERDNSIRIRTLFETRLFPTLKMIFDNDIAKFMPYALQLLAQLVELERPPLSVEDRQMILPFLMLDSWKSSANVPALVRLLQVLLQDLARSDTRGNHVEIVLSIFEMLIISASTDEQGFYILNTVIEYLDYTVIKPFMKNVWVVLFNSAYKQTPKFQKSLVIFMSLFLWKHGWDPLVSSMNAYRENIFILALEKIWIPTLKLITGTIEVKLTVVAATKFICETTAFLEDPSAAKLWGKMLDSIVTLVSRPEQERVLYEPEMPDLGYTAAFVKLHSIGKKEEDPLSDIRDPKQLLASSVARLVSADPSKYKQIIGENLEQANQEALLQLCNAYNCKIV